MDFEIGTGVRRFESPVPSGRSGEVQGQLAVTNPGVNVQDSSAASPVA
jgi:hypothetical protein